MSKGMGLLAVDLEGAMGIFSSAGTSSLRKAALEVALELGEKWEDFEDYLGVHFSDDVDRQKFFGAVLKLADTYQRCLMVCQALGRGKRVTHFAARKMAKFAQTYDEWAQVRFYAMPNSPLKATAGRKLAELSAEEKKR